MNAPADASVAWFCLRSQPKHEHLAAAQLATEPGIEVYLPRIRFRRPTRNGPKWFTEALFPSYLFARFNLAGGLRKIKNARGVRDVVHFGERYPTVSDASIDQLRASIGAEIHVLKEELQPGETVHIAGGALHGLSAVVSRVMPGPGRVAVLLEFLGRQSMVELPQDAVIREADARQSVF